MYIFEFTFLFLKKQKTNYKGIYYYAVKKLKIKLFKSFLNYKIFFKFKEW